MTFGNRLKFLMEERQVSQKEVAKQLNIAPSTLNGYTNDYREPDFRVLSSLASYFDVSTDFLLGLIEVPHFPASAPDEGISRILYYYDRLTPSYQKLLVEEARLFWKFSQSDSST